MKAKYLVFVISALLMLGFSTPASAAWVIDDTDDTANNGTVGDYDIERAVVEFYPDGAGLEEYVDICVDMTESMPGMIMVEFEFDPAVGSAVSLASLFNPCERPAGPAIKPNVPGYDITLNIFLRDQDPSAATAYALDCLGPPAGTCMERIDPCSCTDPTSGCYTSGDTCTPGAAECYLRGPVCTTNGDPCEEGGEICSVLNTLCTDNNPCNLAKIHGEWTVNPYVNSGSQQQPADRGRIDMPLPPGPGEGNGYCFKLPWKRMVEQVWSASPFFNKSLAEDASSIKWQLSTWYDVSGNDDFLQTPPPCCAITDVVPNTGSSNADASTQECTADIDEDCQVGLFDLIKMKNQYGNACTACLP